MALAVEFGLNNVRDAVAELVARRDADRLAEWADRTDDEFLDCWRRAQEDRLMPLLRRQFLAAGRECDDFWRALEVGHPRVARLRLELLAELADLPGRLGDDDWLESLRKLASLPRLKAEEWPPGVKDSVGESLKSFREEIKAWREAAAPDDEEYSRRMAGFGRRFAALGARARLAYESAKRARGGLDFDDLLLKARDLLRDDPAVRRAEGDAARFVLVDEFQDTDPVQSEILRLLTGDGFADGRLFVVGDFKQSIYRFRGARPKLFHEYRGAFPEAGRLELTENFRSVPGVIDFVNALFLGAFEGESGRLLPGRRGPDVPDAPAVEFVWPSDAPAAPPGDDEKKEKPPVGELRKTEARWLARLVRSRLDAGWPVRDRKTGAVRNAHAGDVAMLFRAMTDLAHYERALDDEGIDYHVVGGSSFYAQDEVRDLINVLTVVEDPFNGIALAGALRSPFFGLSDDALYWLGGVERGALAARFLGGEAGDQLPALDRKRADRARDLLERWRSLKDRLPIGDLVDRVLDESGYETALVGEPLGDRKRANARKIARMAREFDDRGGFTLAHFVSRLRADLHEPPKEEQAATTDEEGKSVRLLSIHQSKGLEFPIVVVPDLNRDGNRPGGLVRFDPDLGPLVSAPKSEVKSQGLKVYSAVEKAEEEEEAVRLFYVATTRARDALVLSTGGGADLPPKSPAVKLLDARFDRATGACKVGLPEGWPAPRVRVIGECPAGSAARGARHRPDPLAVVRVVTETRPSSPPTAPFPTPRPGLLDLAARRGTSGRGARLGSLVRAVLADPEAVRPGGLAGAARRAARRQSPRLPGAAADEVARWLERPLAGLFDHATLVEPGAPWSVAWPPGSPGATVVLGWTDLLVRDGRGVWGVVVVSPPGCGGQAERLRWLLSAHAERARGAEPSPWGTRPGSTPRSPAGPGRSTPHSGPRWANSGFILILDDLDGQRPGPVRRRLVERQREKNGFIPIFVVRTRVTLNAPQSGPHGSPRRATENRSNDGPPSTRRGPPAGRRPPPRRGPGRGRRRASGPEGRRTR